jgi:hypothetical protein
LIDDGKEKSEEEGEEQNRQSRDFDTSAALSA